jgi:DNA primase
VAIPQGFIDDLLNRVDIVDVVGRYVQLKRGGANFMGLCPFHGEKSPSFSVSPSKQFFHCFGCGAHGNAIGFLMEHSGMGFVDAVKELAQGVGMKVPQEETSLQEQARAKAARDRQHSLVDLLAKVAEGYQAALRKSPRAIDYLKGRGLSGKVAKAFGLGYAPEGWNPLAGMLPDYADPLLLESGMVIEKDSQGAQSPATDDADLAAAHSATKARRYDRFRDRIMFPIRNVKGEVIGFGGRVLDRGEPKYLNSPETPVFSKGRELYGLFEGRHAIREKGRALVVEGYMDVVALAQLGIGNAVATLGTACTSDHVAKLFKFTDAICFSFDGDKAGQRAARRALEAVLPHAGDLRSVSFLFLPEEHDPDSYVRAFGAEAFEREVAHAMPLSRFLVEAASEDCVLGTAEGRARFAAQARPLWQALPEGMLKTQLLKELSATAQVDQDTLADVWAQGAKRDASLRSAGGGAAALAHTQAQGRSSEGRDEAPFYDPETLPSQGSGDWKGKSKTRFRSDRGVGDVGLVSRAGQVARQGLTRLSAAELAARTVLANSDLWQTLNTSQHESLCALDGAAGEFFQALDRISHDLGALPTSQLLQHLPEELRTWCDRLLPDQALPQPGSQDELRLRLLRFALDDVKAQETEAIGQQDRERYARLLAHRQALVADIAALQNQASESNPV